MIEIQFGRVGRAKIDGRSWASDVAPLQRLLTLETEEIIVHGGIPDADEFIVRSLQNRFSGLITIVSRAESADDEADDETDKPSQMLDG